MRGRIGVGRGDAENAVAHRVERFVVERVAGADDLHAVLDEPAVEHLPHELARLRRRHEQHQRVGLQVLGLLQERRELGRRERRAQLVDDLAAELFEARLERVLRIEAGTVVGDERDGGLLAVLRRPFGDRHGLLRQRETDAHEVRRSAHDHARAGHHDDGGHARLRDERADGERQRRQAEAADHRHLVVDDQFLRDAARLVCDAGVVAHEQLDLLARHRVSVVRHEQARARQHLAARGGLRAGQRKNEPDAHGFLCESGSMCKGAGGERAGCNDVSATELHEFPLVEIRRYAVLRAP